MTTRTRKERTCGAGRLAMLACAVMLCGQFQAQQAQAAAGDKPNILVIWGDDIGQTNISAYSRGMMGYKTPNIDRLADEGVMFTDYYGEQSCTAGRSSFITGQSVFRTGLSKVVLSRTVMLSPSAILTTLPDFPVSGGP